MTTAKSPAVFGRHCTYTASFFTRKRSKVYITEDPEYVGYTQIPKDGTIEITLSLASPLFANDAQGNIITPEKKEYFLYGVLAHEILHQLYTPFASIAKAEKSIDQQYRKYYHEIFNVLEDPAIEYGAPNTFGGPLLKALNAVIQHTWEVSPNIDKNVPDNDESYAYYQIMNALIQIGDKGPVKGVFKSQKAQDVFDEILPIFNEGIREPIGKKRIKYVNEIFDIIRPLLAVMPQGQMNGSTGESEGKGDGSAVPQNNSSGSESSDSGNTQSDNASSNNNNSKNSNFEETKNNSSNKNAKENKSDDKDDASDKKKSDGNRTSSNTNGEKTDNFTPGDGTNDKPITDITSEDLEEFFGEMDNAEKEVLSEEERQRLSEQMEDKDIPSGTEYIQHNKNTQPCPFQSEYNKILAQHNTAIKSLENELKLIIKGDFGGKTNSEHGSKINLRRVSDGKLHTKIMVSHTAPKDIKNTAIYILIDESGSMSGEKCLCARDTAICLYESITELGIPVSVCGFTTMNEKALHHHYLTWHSPKNHKSSLLKIHADNCNYDYWSIQQATREFEKFPSKHKLLIVLSDGEPCANYNVNIESGNVKPLTKRAINEARTKNISVLGVAITPYDQMTYAAMYGKDYIVVNKPQDMFLNIGSAIRRIVKTW